MPANPKIDHVRYHKDIGSYFRPFPESDFIVYDKVLSREPSAEYQVYADTSKYDTLIVKVGTNIVTHDEQRRTAHNMQCIAEDLKRIKDERKMNILLVSSGAIGLGRKERLRRGDNIPKNEENSPQQKQRDAFEGQDMLYSLWLQSLYPEFTMKSLVTHDDMRFEQKKEKLFRGYKDLLERGIMPVINEDDKRSLEEIDILLKGERMFRDNDGLASLIAQQLSSEGYKTLLVILSNTDGIYTAESCKNGQFTPIRVVKDSADLEEQVFLTTSKRGRGGMMSKIIAARDAALNGVYVAIVNGQYCNHDGDFQKKKSGAKRRYDVLRAILERKVVGTRFMPRDYLIR